MALDTSAIVAILLDEPERPAFDRLIEDDRTRLFSGVTRVEATFVIEGRKGEPGREWLDRFFRLAGAEVVAATLEQTDVASPA
jgi:ribonuclease VapC